MSLQHFHFQLTQTATDPSPKYNIESNIHKISGNSSVHVYELGIYMVSYTYV